MQTATKSSLDPARRLRLTEIFVSLQGEALATGAPTVFVRLTGCPLRCHYCDTAYAFSGGDWHDIGDVVATVAGYGVRHVCVTGGEPLAQPNCLALLSELCDAGLTVSLETSGAIDIAGVDARVSRVLDIKTPGSGECERNRWENIDCLTAHDQVKFVVTDRADFDWALGIVEQYALAGRCTVFVSPSHEELPARRLADWLVSARAPLRLQVQLHKYLWGDEPGR